LSISEIQELRDIAIPHYALSNAAGTEEDSCYSSKPETEVRSKKRKSSTGSEGSEPQNLTYSKKRGHNATEKRYRSNLNDKIAALRQRVPGLRDIPEGELADAIPGEAEGPICDAGPNCGKAEILTGAVEYIHHLERAIERLGSEVVLLETRVMAFEKLAMSGSIVISNRPSPRTLITETLQAVQASKLRWQYTNLY
jgi:hypothetical protein